MQALGRGMGNKVAKSKNGYILYSIADYFNSMHDTYNTFIEVTLLLMAFNGPN